MPFNLRQQTGTPPAGGVPENIRTARIKLSKPAARLVALIENARDLVLQHQRRQDASKVVLAAAAIASGLHQDPLHLQLRRLAEEVKDKNNVALIQRFDAACREVIAVV